MPHKIPKTQNNYSQKFGKCFEKNVFLKKNLKQFCFFEIQFKIVRIVYHVGLA